MTEFLASSPWIDFESPSLAGFLDDSGWRELEASAAAAQAYRYVRDQICHCYDVQDRRITISASDAFREGVGLCYSKSHLLAALLRGLGIPAAIRYQRLRLSEAPDAGFCLHSFCAVWLDGAWRDLDARGNNGFVTAEFLGRLAFCPDEERGEETVAGYFAEPAASVVEALVGADDVLGMRLPEGV